MGSDKVKKQNLASFMQTYKQVYSGNDSVVFYGGEFIQ